MTLRFLKLDNHPKLIAVSKTDAIIEDGRFFLDFSRPLEKQRWFGVWNRRFGFTNGLLVPVIHQGEQRGGYVIGVHRSDSKFLCVLRLWKNYHPLENTPSVTFADGTKIIADFVTQFPND